MPDHVAALPAGAYNVSPDLTLFTRTGIDGAEVIVPIFGGDKFIGEVLDGKWVKNVNEAYLVGYLSGGKFYITTTAGVTYRDYTVYSTHQIILQEGIEIIAKIETEHNSVAVGEYFNGNFSISDTRAQGGKNAVECVININQVGVRAVVVMRKNNVYTEDYYGGYGNGRYFLFRIRVIQGRLLVDIMEEGESEYTNVYEDDNHFLNQPLNVCFKARNYCSTTQTITYFCHYVTVNYPHSITAKYDLATSDLTKGDCKVFDTMGSGDENDWQRVYDADHTFTGDCVIQNGLIRLWIDEAAQYGLKLYYYNGASWVQPFDQYLLYLVTDTDFLEYPYLSAIKLLSSETIAVKVRVCESDSDDDDYYAILELTLKRGSYVVETKILEVYPLQKIRVYLQDSTTLRWGYVGDAEAHGIGDDDLGLDADNTTFTDNFLMAFDDAGSAVIGLLATNLEPTTKFEASDGGDLCIYSISHANFESLKIFVGLIPIDELANYFVEAEDATLVGSASVVDLGDDSGQSVKLDVQNDEVYFELSCFDDIPQGRYLLIVRAKDLNQVADDLGIAVENTNDSYYTNEERAFASKTCTASFAYYQCVFDVHWYIEASNTLRIHAKKLLADANDIWIDSFLIIPIGNGYSYPKDIARQALSKINRNRRVYKR